MKLRKYQEDCVAAVLKQLETGNALVSMSTGSGKSIVFSKLVSLLEMSGSVLILTNQVRLVEQGFGNLELFNDDIGIYNASLGKKEIKKITISTIQSIINCAAKWKYVLIDEGHNFDERTGQFKRFVDFQGAFTMYVSFTATPFSTDDYIYGPERLFKSVTYEKTLRDLTPEFLVPLKHCNGKNAINTDGLKILCGDYLKSQLSERVLSDLPKMQAQVTDALSKCVGKTVWCCISIEHAEAVHKMIPNSIIVHSKGNRSIEGNWQHVINVMMLTEGVDIPSLQTIVLLRPTRSPRLYIQMVGRVLRQYPDKDFGLLLDYGHVIENLGSIYDAKPNNKPSLRLCYNCESFNPARLTHCHYCNTQFQTQCPICFSMKPVAVKCENCATKTKRQGALLANLSEQSHSDYKVEMVDSVKIYPHSKSNIDMIRVVYYRGIMKISEVYLDERNNFRSYLYRKFIKECTLFDKHPNIQEVIANPEKVICPAKLVLKKNGKWFNVIEVIYE